MTLQIITEPKEQIAQYVIERINSTSTPDDLFRYTALGLLKDNKLVAGLIYTDYVGTSIDIHIGAHPNKRWMTKELLIMIFHYPFIQLGVQRITAKIASKNKDARNLAERWGFTQEGAMREAIKDDDLIIYGMLKNECKWIENDSNK